MPLQGGHVFGFTLRIHDRTSLWGARSFRMPLDRTGPVGGKVASRAFCWRRERFSMGEADIVLYHYAASPYAKRIVWYLALRGIPYDQCVSKRAG